MDTEKKPTQDRRARAYRTGAKVTRERMSREAPLDAAALEAVQASDIVVVPGIYDHVEQVLQALEMPFTTVGPAQLGSLHLRPEQLLVVNCPGDGLGRAVPAIRSFVEAGGSLFSTDWALQHVIEPAFPGTLAYNQRPTRDDVVRIEIRSQDNPFLQGVLDPGDDPLWWLEASSYPIKILDPSRVEVLISSSELQTRYGEAPVAVLFHVGEGEVFHMISHYYLQRTELRNARHQQTAEVYAAEKGIMFDAGMAAEASDLTLGDVESAATSSRLLANVLAAKKRKMARAGSEPSTDTERK